MKKEPEAVLTFQRHILEDLAYSLGVMAAKTADAELRRKLEAASGVIRAWLVGNVRDIPCSRSEASWDWLANRAGEAGEKTAALLIRTKLEGWRAAREAAAEKARQDAGYKVEAEALRAREAAEVPE